MTKEKIKDREKIDGYFRSINRNDFNGPQQAGFIRFFSGDNLSRLQVRKNYAQSVFRSYSATDEAKMANQFPLLINLIR